MELPPANSFSHPDKIGYLLKLTGKSFLYPGSWKRRFCVLDDTRLYYYDKEDSKGTEKSCGVINLELHDLCEEATGKDGKKAPNVFVVGVSDKSVFDSGKHLFSAETAADMTDWIQVIQKTFNKIKEKRKEHITEIRATTPTGSKSDVRKQVTLDVPPTSRLPSATKHRPRGPKGRRLPLRKSVIPKSKITFTDELKMPYRNLRATSLSVLELKSNMDLHGKPNIWIPEDFDSESQPRSTAGSEVGSQRDLIYRYSSSEESLVHDNAGEIVSEHNALNLRSGGNVSGKACDQSACCPARDYPYPQDQSVPCGCPPTNLLPWSTGKTETCMSCGEHVPEVPKSDCQDRKKMNAMIRYINLRMSELLHSLASVKGDMTSTQQEVGLIQGNVSSLQAGTGGASDRLDQMSSQILHLECQLISLLKDVESTFHKVEELISEAERAKSQHVELKEQCEIILEELRRTEAALLTRSKTPH